VTWGATIRYRRMGGGRRARVMARRRSVSLVLLGAVAGWAANEWWHHSEAIAVNGAPPTEPVAEAPAPPPRPDAREIATLPPEPERIVQERAAKDDASPKPALIPKRKPRVERAEAESSGDEVVVARLETGTERTAQAVDALHVRQARSGVTEALDAGRQALAVGDIETALYFYAAAIAREPENARGMFGYAAALQANGDTAAARSAYGRLLAVDPDHAEALNNLIALGAESDPEAALATLEAVRRRNPDSAPLLAQMARIEARLGRAGAAIRRLHRAVDLAPDEPVYALNLAVLLDGAGRSGEALGHYERVLRAAYAGAPLAADIGEIEARAGYLRTRAR